MLSIRPRASVSRVMPKPIRQRSIGSNPATCPVVAERDDAFKRLFTWLCCAQRTADKVRQRKPRPRLPFVSED